MGPLCWLKTGIILYDCFTKKISSAFHAFACCCSVTDVMIMSHPNQKEDNQCDFIFSSSWDGDGTQKDLDKIPVHMLHLVFDFRKLFSLSHSVTQSCPTLCNPMDCIMQGFPVYQQLPETAQIHVHWVGDIIQPFYPLSSPPLLTFNLSQHQGLFQWVSSSHQIAKVVEFQHPSFQWIFRTDFL